MKQPTSDRSIFHTLSPKMMFLPVAVGSAVALIVGIISFLFVPGPDKALNRTVAVTAIVCCWLMWVCVYMSQMYPLAAPQRALGNHSS